MPIRQIPRWGWLSSLLLFILGCAQERAPAGVLSWSVPIQTQGVARRWAVGDIHHFQVTLQAPDATVSLSVPPDKRQIAFSNLRQGVCYEVSLEAWGSPGGDSSSVHLNANHPANGELDFRASNDVRQTISQNLALRLDDVPFSGTLKLLPQNLPAWTKSLEVDLLVDSVSRYSATYSPRQTMTLTRLKSGVDYEIILTAKGGKRSQVATQSFRFDSSSPQLEQDQSLNIPF